MAKGIRINKSKIVHLYWEATDRTDCGAGGMSEASLNGTPTDDAVTCKRCLKALAAEIERAHAKALEEDERRTIARAYLSTPSGVVLTAAEIEQAVADRDAENEAYFDALAVRYAQEDAAAAPAPVLSRRQRRAARRAQRAKLRRMAPQTRAAARARRVRRGATRGTAKTLLVAVGVPQDIANRYASSFSRGTQARTASERMGKRNSKRVEVKRYTWAEFAGRLSGYHPGSHPRGDVAVAFNAARDRVLAMA